MSAAALDRATTLVISVSTCCSGRSCTEYRNLAGAAERRNFERVRTAVWHFHPRRPARHSRHRYSTNVARLVTEKSCDMLHRHMALDRIAADHGRVARRQLVGHAISRLYGSHVRAVLDGHRIALSAGNIGPRSEDTRCGTKCVRP